MELEYILCIVSLVAYFVVGIYIYWEKSITKRFKNTKDRILKIKTAKIVPRASITTREIDSVAVEVVVPKARIV
tara:strand:- start:461 stop:682 length:222 start_codon:yes stop_codon:yes gene_type:complete